MQFTQRQLIILLTLQHIDIVKLEPLETVLDRLEDVLSKGVCNEHRHLVIEVG
jgi:hypothetical protein